MRLVSKEKVQVWCKKGDEWTLHYTNVRIGTTEEKSFFRIVNLNGSREYYWNPEDCKEHRAIDDESFQQCANDWESRRVTQNVEVESEVTEDESESSESVQAWADYS